MDNLDESFNLKKSLEIEMKEIAKRLEVARMEGDFREYNILTKNMMNLTNVYRKIMGGYTSHLLNKNK